MLASYSSERVTTRDYCQLSDLNEIYEKNNRDLNDLGGAEGIFLGRLGRELRQDETVRGLISFRLAFRTMMGKPAWRSALLVVTSRRVIQMSAPQRFLGMMMDAAGQAGSPDELEVASMEYDAIAGVSGRRTVLSVGLERELYLDRKSGSFVKIQGLTVAKSELAEKLIREALMEY
jgi:hypothetical protein